MRNVAPIVQLVTDLHSGASKCNGMRIDPEFVVTALHCHNMRYVIDSKNTSRSAPRRIIEIIPRADAAGIRNRGTDWEKLGDILVIKTERFDNFDKTVILDDDGDYDFKEASIGFWIPFNRYRNPNHPPGGDRTLVPNMKITLLPREACVHSISRTTDYEGVLCSCTSIPFRQQPYELGRAWLLLPGYRGPVRYEDTTGELDFLMSSELRNNPVPRNAFPVGFLRQTFIFPRMTSLGDMEIQSFYVRSNGNVYVPIDMQANGVSELSGSPIFQKATVPNVFKFIGVFYATPQDADTNPIKLFITQVAHWADYIRQSVDNDNFRLGQVSPSHITWSPLKISYCPNVDCVSLNEKRPPALGTLLCNYNALSYYKICTTLPHICDFTSSEHKAQLSQRCEGYLDCFDAYQFVGKSSDGRDIHFRPVFINYKYKVFPIQDSNLVGTYSIAMQKEGDNSITTTQMRDMTVKVSSSAMSLVRRKINPLSHIYEQPTRFQSIHATTICSASRLIDENSERMILRACYNGDTSWMEKKSSRSGQNMLNVNMFWSILDAPVRMHRFSMHSKDDTKKFPYELNEIRNFPTSFPILSRPPITQSSKTGTESPTCILSEESWRNANPNPNPNLVDSENRQTRYD